MTILHDHQFTPVADLRLAYRNRKRHALLVLPTGERHGDQWSSTTMPDTIPPDLFTAAGIPLDVETAQPKPKRASRARKPTPAEKAAAGRLEGARRLRPPQAPSGRTRVGRPRDLSPTPVLAFPLARNAAVVAEVIERLPHGYASDLDTICGREAKRLAKRLQRKGMSQKSARECANDLLHEAYTIRVRDAHRETEVL